MEVRSTRHDFGEFNKLCKHIDVYFIRNGEPPILGRKFYETF